MPFSNFLQSIHNVGFVYEWTTKVCGMRILPASSRSTHAGRPMFSDGERFSRVGGVESSELWSSMKVGMEDAARETSVPSLSLNSELGEGFVGVAGR